MATEFAALYGYTSRDIERIASCRRLLDAVVLYYLNFNACYIIYKRKKYREEDIAYIAAENEEYLLEHFSNSSLYRRVVASIDSYIKNVE